MKQKKSVEQYTHNSKKRRNNPPVGLVTPGTDPDDPSKVYDHDPRIDPYLVWSGKQESQQFDVDTVSLHVHERVDPATIIEKVIKAKPVSQQTLFLHFEKPENNLPLRKAVDFYKHEQGWSNRLIAGDSLLVMNSLLEKEGMEGKVQTIYIDPPYGIKYHSNFQPFVSQKNAKDGNDKDLTQEPEMIKAFRDTWELGIHSYLSYLRNRLHLAKKLLKNDGSVFVQISNENLHHVREVMDEVFGSENFCGIIVFAKTLGKGSKLLDTVNDYIVWHAKNKKQVKYRQLYLEKIKGRGLAVYNFVENNNGERRRLTNSEKQDPSTYKNLAVFNADNLTSQTPSKSTTYEFEFNNRKFRPGSGGWKTNLRGMKNLAKKNRLIVTGNTLCYVRYLSDFPFVALNNIWDDVSIPGFVSEKLYVVRTNSKVIERCILMTTDPGDLVLDPTCGSGTTAYVAEKWGRRWITCDTSRIAIAVTRKRLMTAFYDYYVLTDLGGGGEEESESSNDKTSFGFNYKKVPHITLRSQANGSEPDTEIIYDDPEIDGTKSRVSGPFTIESVPSPVAKSVDALFDELQPRPLSKHIDDTSAYQQEWRDELLKTGIRGKGGQKLEFLQIDTHTASRWIHAWAEVASDHKTAIISFGPVYAPLEQRQVELALEEARTLVPKPDMLIFVAMQFDPEAAKDIDETNWPEITILKAEINKDLLTGDLKKKRSSDDSFWLVGQPDVSVKKIDDGSNVVTLNGFDYYDTRTGDIKSGGSSQIAMWMLDEDYDGRSLYPGQVFFPMDKNIGKWGDLAKTLNAQIDYNLLEKYRGTVSLPFKTRSNKRVAVKIIDDRGIESIKIIGID